MVVYEKDLAFPVQWEDFYCKDKDKKHPDVTLVTRTECEQGGEEESIPDFLFIVLNVAAIDEQTAKQAIAAAISVPVEEIEFVDSGWRQV